MTFLRTKPSLTYSGLTVVLSNPSRFDKVRLLTSGGGHVLNDFCLRPELNVMQCDIRVADDPAPLLPGTRCVVVLGEYAMHKLLPATRQNTLNEMRGSFQTYQGLPAIPSFYPQDAADPKNFEKEFNAEHMTFAEEDSGEGDEEDDGKTHGRTDRKNYAFWMRADLRKAKYILKNGLPPVEPEPQYVNSPSSQQLIDVLSTTKDCFMDFDIETDYEEQNLQCFSFTFDGKVVYNVPILDYNYQPAYSHLPQIFRALAKSFKRNVLVAHNGACFDFIVLPGKYRIPIYEVYDTMCAMHRCFPTIEKSLGHCTSYWTWQQFHKDEDSRGYRTPEQMKQRMAYCGKDVFTMHLIRKAIAAYAKTIPGLEDSINTVMKQIVPYITTTLQGIRYDETLRQSMRAENDRLMEQYLRMIKILIGETGLVEVQSCLKGKAKAFPGSNKQCVQYFHNILGYPIVHRSKPDKHGVRNPSLAKQAMYKLRLKHNNPVIDLCNLYRGVKLETTTPLGFYPWKNDKGEVNREVLL